MSPNLMSKLNIQNAQSGSALVLAVFILVVMTLLGAALVRMMSSTAETVAYEVIGTRAYQAAQVGIQWQLTEIFPLNTTGITRCKPNIIEPVISGVEGLGNCEFNIECNDDIFHNNIRYYNVISTGSCSVAGVETSRVVEVEARSLN